MSLLTETVSTVIYGNNMIALQAFNTQFVTKPNAQGYSVITGAIEPREEGNYLLLDNVTGLPVQLPPNVMPYKAFYVPTVPLEGPNLSSSELKLRFWDDVNFSSYQDNWGTYGVFTAEEMNTKGYTELADSTGSVSDFTGYIYPGMVLESDPLTAGQIQIYIYYITAQTPILPDAIQFFP